MEGKRSSSGFSSTSHSSLPPELFGRKDPAASSANSGSSSGLFSTMFSATVPPVGKRDSSRSEIFGKQDSAYSAISDRTSHGSPGKGHNFVSKERNSNYRGEKVDPFSLSSSLYYGGQDVYSNAPSSYNSGVSYNHRPYKKEGEDGSASSPVDSRGDWWQGSLYY